MRIVISFDCDNASFEDDFFGAVKHALAQASRKIAAQHRRPKATVCTALEAEDKILDVNGNTIGKVSVES